ncbi:hypothetical protein Lal_00034122 [Lupinus albus]|nr:hypothetical protein Lal_00034122 [Lupinus albus]
MISYTDIHAFLFSSSKNQLEIYGGIHHTVEAQQIDCGGKCNYRCSKASRPNRCLRACNTCCERCNCVPPGTSGNTELCPCYANMETVYSFNYDAYCACVGALALA